MHEIHVKGRMVMNLISNRLLRAVGVKQSLESAASIALEPTVCFGNV